MGGGHHAPDCGTDWKLTLQRPSNFHRWRNSAQPVPTIASACAWFRRNSSSMALSARPILNKIVGRLSGEGLSFERRRGWWKEIAYCHAEDFSKNCNSLVSDRGTPRFNIGEDVASHASVQTAKRTIVTNGQSAHCTNIQETCINIRFLARLRNRLSTGQVAGQETGQVTISLSGQVHGADTKTDTKRIKKDTFG